MIVLKCLGHAAEPSIPCKGLYLADFDFDAPFDDRALPGSGRPTFTADVEKAKRFPNLAVALGFIKTISTAHPIRRDGELNRPATGYTWEFQNTDKPPFNYGVRAGEVQP